jgi:hypothetical protein
MKPHQAQREKKQVAYWGSDWKSGPDRREPTS